MPGILLSKRTHSFCAERIEELRADFRADLQVILLPEEPSERLSEDQRIRVRAAYFSPDIMGPSAAGFFSAVHRAPNLEWLHTFNTGIDHPIFGGLIDRGVTITNHPIVAAVPIAQTAIGALLMLGRGFPHWLSGQRRRTWSPQPVSALPRRLEEQNLVVFGLGAIGREMARLARAIGMHVIGVRRTPCDPADPVDRWVHPERLREVLPEADFLAITCPLTEQTRGCIDAEVLRSLPTGAKLINVARGEIVDEGALIEALREGHLGGAYLDVFATEPLPEESPLWELPNVIVSPHNAAASLGIEQRHVPGFLANLERFVRKQPLHDVASRR